MQTNPVHYEREGSRERGPLSRSSSKLAALLVMLILAQEWILAACFGPSRPLGALTLSLCLLISILYNSRTAGRNGHWGFSRVDFRPALKWTMLMTLPLVAVIFLAGVTLGTLPGREHPMRDLLYLFPWALAQQFALQTVILQEARRELGPKSGVLLAAVVFSLLHLPNPFLVPATFVGGYLWCWIFDRHPNLLPLALSHSICSLAVLVAIPRSLTGGLRVGYLFWS